MPKKSTAARAVTLPEAPAAIRAATGTSIPYGRLYRACLDGKIPHERRDGRIHIAPRDFSTIIAELGDERAAA